MLFLISQYAIQCHLLVKITDRCWSLDANGDYNTNQMVTSWQNTCESIKESIKTLRELIDVRDGYSESTEFTSDEIDEFILALCTGYS